MKNETRKYGKEYFMHVNFAHRGLHDIAAGIPENSLAAFRAAAQAGYGAELDVQLSKDGQVVVFHDDTLDRVCSVRGNVCDFDYSELHQMKLCGTDETISLFSDVLEVFSHGGGPLLVELKSGSRNTELCEKTYQLLKGYPGVFCIESFHPFIVNWFRKNAPDIFRGQLSQPADEYPGSIPRFAAKILSACAMSFLNRPDFIAYEIGKRPPRVLRMREKGTMLFAWTSKEPDKDQLENDAVIFENYRPALRY